MQSQQREMDLPATDSTAPKAEAHQHSTLTSNSHPSPNEVQDSNDREVLKEPAKVSIPPFRTLDIWRGLAALWVVLHHASGILVTKVNPQLATAPLIQFGLWGNLGVQVFFVVSGYCIAHAALAGTIRGQTVSAFTWARLRRIYPPMWASLGVVLLSICMAKFLVANHIVKSSAFAQTDLASHSLSFWVTNFTLTQLLMKPIYGPFPDFLSVVCWTLCYEVAFYAIVAGAMIVGRRRQSAGDPTAIFPILHIMTILCLLGLVITPEKVLYPFDMWPQFGLGVLVFDFLHSKDRKRVAARNWLLLAIGLTMAYAVCHPLQPNGHMGEPSGVAFAVTLAAVFGMLLLFRWDRLMAGHGAARPLMVLGGYSYSLYLIHFAILGVVNQLTQRVAILKSHPYLLLTVMVLASLAGGYVFFLAFERPFMSRRNQVRVVA